VLGFQYVPTFEDSSFASRPASEDRMHFTFKREAAAMAIFLGGALLLTLLFALLGPFLLR
jgi:hypothetical protein